MRFMSKGFSSVIVRPLVFSSLISGEIFSLKSLSTYGIPALDIDLILLLTPSPSPNCLFIYPNMLMPRFDSMFFFFFIKLFFFFFLFSRQFLFVYFYILICCCRVLIACFFFLLLKRYKCGLLWFLFGLPSFIRHLGEPNWNMVFNIKNVFYPIRKTIFLCNSWVQRLIRYFDNFLYQLCSVPVF